MDTQNAEVIELTLESKIETALVKQNVTQAVIAALKDKYGGMTLKSLDDKESYLEIKAAARDCSKLRNLASKVCKEGREDAIKIQKLWVAKEKDVIAQIAEVENPLDAEIAKYDAEVERKANEEKQRQEEAYINRQQVLTRMGATYTDGNFVLGSASFEAVLVKGASQDIWDEAIVPKFKAEYEIIEKERIAEQKKKDDEAAELKRKQDLLAEQQRQFEEQQKQFKQQQEEATRKENERIAEDKRLKAEADNNRWRSRLALLDEAGWNGQFAFPRLGDSETKIFTYDELVELSDETFTSRMKEYNQSTALLKKEIADKAEEKRIADIEEAKQKAIKDEQEKQAELKRQAEIKHQQEEQRKQAELEAAGDKVKWETFIKQVGEIATFEMRSGQYRKKMQIAKERIEEILSL